MSDVESDGEDEGGRPWAPWEDELLMSAVEPYRTANINVNWADVVGRLHEGGSRRTVSKARNREIRIKKGPGRNNCKICGQKRRGHTCTGPPKTPKVAMNAANSSGSALSAEPTATAVPALTPEEAAARDAAIAAADRAEEWYRAVLAHREVEAEEAAASSAATLEAVASSVEPSAATDLTPSPPASRPTTPVPITPLGDAARTAPAGGTVRPPSPSYGFQSVAPPVLPEERAPALNSAEVAFVVFSVPSPQRMPSIPLDAMDPSMGTFGTTVALPDEPTPLALDVDHLERTRVSPPYDPCASSVGESVFEERPSFDPSGTADGSAAGGGWY